MFIPWPLWHMLKHCRPDNLARGHLSLLHRETIPYSYWQTTMGLLGICNHRYFLTLTLINQLGTTAWHDESDIICRSPPSNDNDRLEARRDSQLALITILVNFSCELGANYDLIWQKVVLGIYKTNLIVIENSRFRWYTFVFERTQSFSFELTHHMLYFLIVCFVSSWRKLYLLKLTCSYILCEAGNEL